MRNSEELKVLMDKINEFTYQYAMELGVQLDGNGFVSCLYPDHVDSDPSMKWWEDAGVFHCFGCGRTVDSFALAHIFEDKPMSGPDFIEENVFYLAKKYGMAYEHLQKELTPEEIERQQYYRTMKIFSDYVVAKTNKSYLEKRGINEDVAKKLLIGSVTSYEDCENFLLKNGCRKDIIDTIGIDSYKVNQEKMIIIIKDEFGRPCSFVSRDMFWTKEKGGPKYINGNTTDIFDKSRIFYGWSDIKKEYNPLIPIVIVEGYLDFVSAYQRGLRNIIAIGSASFTDAHIAIIEKDRRIRVAAIALDQDATGKKRMKSIMERLKNNPTTKEYKFAVYKEPGKDIDEIFKENPEFKKASDIFDLKTLFEFRLMTIKEELGEDIDESQLFDEFVAIICKTKSPKEREEQVRVLSKYINSYSHVTILDAVREEVDGKTIMYNDDVKKKAKFAMDEITKSPEHTEAIIDDLKEDIKDLNEKYGKKKTNYKDRMKENFLRFETLKNEASLFDVNFEIPWLDDLESMVPGNSVVISSLANTGKSTFYQLVAKNVPKLNDNAIVYYCSTDDPAEKVLSNLIASISGLNRNYCITPMHHRKWGLAVNNSQKARDMYERYEKARDFMLHLIETGKFVIFDVKDGVDTWRGLEDTVKEIANDPENEKKFKILIVDSVNKVQVPGMPDENATAGFLSANIKKLSERYKFLSFLNFELNKMKNNKRLSQYNLSGSRRMFYDCDVLGFVYNPIRNLQNVGHKTEMVWKKKGEDGFEYEEPVLVTMQEKTKAGNNERNNYPYFYMLDSAINRLIPIKPHSPEHEHYLRIWEYEFNEFYTDN